MDLKDLFISGAVSAEGIITFSTLVDTAQCSDEVKRSIIRETDSLAIAAMRAGASEVEVDPESLNVLTVTFKNEEAFQNYINNLNQN